MMLPDALDVPAINTRHTAHIGSPADSYFDLSLRPLCVWCRAFRETLQIKFSHPVIPCSNSFDFENAKRGADHEIINLRLMVLRPVAPPIKRRLDFSPSQDPLTTGRHWPQLRPASGISCSRPTDKKLS
jgi:hypothetical protein